MNNIFEKIQQDVDGNDVLLYMKGSPDFPQCGFSALVVNVLNQYDIPYKAVDVLQDMEIREGIKAFSEWPTIPQLYVKGEFIGGCDIVKEMQEAGELEALFKQVGLL